MPCLHHAMLGECLASTSTTTNHNNTPGNIGSLKCHGWAPILHEAQCVATGAAEVSSKRRRTDVQTDTTTAAPPDDQPNDFAATGTDGVAKYACKGY